jgi:hypothetical protein
VEILVGAIAVVLVVAVVAWFVVAKAPSDEADVERADGSIGRTVEQGHFGPAGAGAEPQVGPANRTTDTPPPRS